MKPSTRLVVRHAVRNLRDYFRDCRINVVTAGDAEDFQRWLATDGRGRHGRGGLAPATVGKRLQRASAIFRDAQRRKLIDENPFAGLKLPPATNRERQRYVPAETIEALLDVIPDPEFRLLLVMARYLGLRVPSEPFSLTWDCVDWERGRLRVPSPKTATHAKPFRVVPILPRVRPHLEAVYDAAEEGSKFILHRLRQRDSMRAAERGFWGSLNLRKRLMDYLAKAGIPPWPKLYHNLRGSAATDLAQRFPAHVCSEWLGHTAAIAEAHYLMTTEAHFQAALVDPDPSTQRTTRKTTRAVRAGSDFEAHREQGHQKTPCFQGVSENQVGMTGFEPATSTSRT
uniref:Site-specific integrase n=1 Tax=Schlesneria paludicola TaxID=360056 RepID=A0A7C4QP52_9PLAN